MRIKIKGRKKQNKKNKMKRKYKIQIKSDIVKYAWEKYKNKLTMEELSKVIGIPLPTFFRLLKKNSNEQEKVVENEQ